MTTLPKSVKAFTVPDDFRSNFLRVTLVLIIPRNKKRPKMAQKRAQKMANYHNITKKEEWRKNVTIIITTLLHTYYYNCVITYYFLKRGERDDSLLGRTQCRNLRNFLPLRFLREIMFENLIVSRHQYSWFLRLYVYLSKLISCRNLSGRNILEFTHCVRNSIFCQWRTEERIIIVPKKFYITKEITTSNITFIYY